MDERELFLKDPMKPQKLLALRLALFGNGLVPYHFRERFGIRPFARGIALRFPRGGLFRRQQRPDHGDQDQKKQNAEDPECDVQRDHKLPSVFCCLRNARYARTIANAPLGMTIMLVDPISDGTRMNSSDIAASTISATVRFMR